ncbi:hypothetical protein Srufu_018370 [Streptomyces libani subsp. rufus]|nr:hypothetical protein Srufu_018370 [Streptomyces libani subsp. rufus]
MLAPPTPATWRIALPRGATAVPIARAMVRTAMQDLRVTADRTTAQLLTAELVTNALKHTCGPAPIELVVEQRPTGCRIEVHDDSPLLVEGLGDPVPLGEPGVMVVGAPGGGAAGRPPGGPSGGPSAGRTSDGQVPMQRGRRPGGPETAPGRALVGTRDLTRATGSWKPIATPTPTAPRTPVPRTTPTLMPTPTVTPPPRTAPTPAPTPTPPPRPRVVCC